MTNKQDHSLHLDYVEGCEECNNEQQELLLTFSIERFAKLIADGLTSKELDQLIVMLQDAWSVKKAAEEPKEKIKLPY